MESNYAWSTWLFIWCFHNDGCDSNVEVLKFKSELWRAMAQLLRNLLLPFVHWNRIVWVIHPPDEIVCLAMADPTIYLF